MANGDDQKPWEKYKAQSAGATGPWTKYQAAPASKKRYDAPTRHQHPRRSYDSRRR